MKKLFTIAWLFAVAVATSPVLETVKHTAFSNNDPGKACE